MNEIKWTKKNILIWGILLIFGIIVYNIATRSLDNKIKSILDDCGYAVGTVKTFFIPNNPPSPYLRYNYNVGGTEFEGKEYYIFPPREGVEAGEKYIVAYSNNNMKKSLMLFKYPIKQEADFENYLEEFKVSPPRFIPRKETRNILYIDF